jgi:hypothetical protein
VTEPPQADDGNEGAGGGASLDALLSDPLVWEEPPPGLEDLVVAAIAAEAEERGPAPGPLRTPGAPAWGGRAWVRPFLVGAAAASAAAILLVVVVGGLGSSDEDRSGGTEVALAGTDLAPDAAAVATVADTPLGTVVDLDVSDLAAAPEGTYYQAWLRQDGDDGELVSAGTFHMRGGDGEIALWAGVSAEQYPVLTVTLQEEGEGPASSGEVVLRGRVDG